MTRDEITARRQQNLLRQEYLKLCKPTLPHMNYLINKVRYAHIVTAYEYSRENYLTYMRQFNILNGIREEEK